MTKADPLGLLAVLEAGELRLEPLEEHHREELRIACAEDVAIWQMYGLSYDPDHFDESFAGLLANPARLAFAILVGGELAGMTAWINADAKWLSAEIGNTYIRLRHRGGAINGPMKRLLFAQVSPAASNASTSTSIRATSAARPPAARSARHSRACCATT